MSAMAEAIATVTGRRRQFEYHDHDLRYAGRSLAGFTDAGTIRLALSVDGVPDSELPRHLPAVVAEMTDRLLHVRADAGSSAGPNLLPGVRSMLERLHGAGWRLGMSTGNAATVARWKMRRVGLDDMLHHGGFGDSAVDRRDVAVRGVAAVAGGADRRHGVLVGDTVGDVLAARRRGSVPGGRHRERHRRAARHRGRGRGGRGAGRSGPAGDHVAVGHRRSGRTGTTRPGTAGPLASDAAPSPSTRRAGAGRAPQCRQCSLTPPTSQRCAPAVRRDRCRATGWSARAAGSSASPAGPPGAGGGRRRCGPAPTGW
ncbi:HAD family hydrolase [Micromonospora sp. R77]|uniref:HAD family hydrolase n=1 Tax=Micromonospora sp. R77 TaxID=2925836 RepID=UPI0035B1E586